MDILYIVLSDSVAMQLVIHVLCVLTRPKGPLHLGKEAELISTNEVLVTNHITGTLLALHLFYTKDTYFFFIHSLRRVQFHRAC